MSSTIPKHSLILSTSSHTTTCFLLHISNFFAIFPLGPLLSNIVTIWLFRSSNNSEVWDTKTRKRIWMPHVILGRFEKMNSKNTACPSNFDVKNMSSETPKPLATS